MQFGVNSTTRSLFADRLHVVISQESRAIAKMTARIAMHPYMDAMKNFGSPGIRPRLLFPKLLMGFCWNQSY